MNELKNALKKLTDLYGVELLYQDKCVSILEKLYPNLPKVYLNTIKYFINIGINKQVYIITQGEDYDIILLNLKDRIFSNYFLSPKQLIILDEIIQLNVKIYFEKKDCLIWLSKFEHELYQIVENYSLDVLFQERLINLVKVLCPELEGVYLNTVKYYITTGILEKTSIITRAESNENELFELKNYITENYFLSFEQLMIFDFFTDFLSCYYLKENDLLSWWDQLDFEWKIIFRENVKNYNEIEESSLIRAIYNLTNLTIQNHILPIVPLVDKLVNLESITLLNCYNVDLYVFKNLKKLKSLTIVIENEDSYNLDALDNFFLLESLTIKCYVSDFFIGNLNISNLINLKELSLEFYNDEIFKLENDFLDNLIGLKYLKLINVELDERSFDKLINLKYLYFKVNEYYSVDEENEYYIKPRLNNLLFLESLTIVNFNSYLKDIPNPLLLKNLTFLRCAVGLSDLLNFKNIESLCLYNCQIIKTGYNDNIDEFNNLKKITIYKCNGFNPLNRLNNLKNLISLIIYENNFLIDKLYPFNFIPAIYNLIKLESLSIKRVDEFEINSYLDKLVNLKSLVLEFNDKIQISLEKIKNLEHLTLINQNSYVNINHLQKLKSLSILNSEFLNDINQINNLYKLESLTISNCPNMKKLDSLKTLNSIKKISLVKCENLEIQFTLFNLNILNKISVFPNKFLFTSDFKNKTVLKLNGYKKIKSDLKYEIENKNELKLILSKNIGLIPNLDMFINLETLVISDFNFLKIIPSLCNLVKLKTITFINCWRLSDISNLENLFNLEVINIIDCPELISISSFDNLVNLKKISFVNCGSLVDIPNLNVSHNLECVDIINCGKLYSINFLSKAKEIKKLNLSNLKIYKQFYDFDNLNGLKSLTIKNCDNLILNINFEKLINIQHLKIVDYNQDFVPDLTLLNNLISLSFEHCPKIKMIPTLNNLKNLQYLNFKNCKSLDSIPSLINLKKLLSFKISNCINLSLIIDLDKLINLKSLVLHNCPNLKSKHSLNNLLNLIDLNIEYCNNLEIVSNVENLETLNIKSHNSNNNFILNNLISLKNLNLKNSNLPYLFFENSLDLKNVNIKNCSFEFKNFICFDKVTKISYFGSCESDSIFSFDNLKTLIITFFKKNLFLEKSFDIQNNLEELILNNFPSFNEISILYNLKKLRKLMFYNIDDEIKPLSDINKFIDLQFLSFKNCNQITTVSTQEYLINLQYLNFDSCSKLKSISIFNNLCNLKTLIFNNLNELKSFSPFDDLTKLEILLFQNCYSLELIPNLDNLKKLNSLSFINCGMIKFIPSLDKLIKLENLSFINLNLKVLPCLDNLINLEYLIIQGCYNLEAIPQLNNLINLKSLKIDCCKKIFELPRLDNLVNLKELRIENCSNLLELPKREDYPNIIDFYVK